MISDYRWRYEPRDGNNPLERFVYGPTVDGVRRRSHGLFSFFSFVNYAAAEARWWLGIESGNQRKFIFGTTVNTKLNEFSGYQIRKISKIFIFLNLFGDSSEFISILLDTWGV